MKAIQSGLRAWLIQRFSAAYMLLFLLYALASWTLDRPVDDAAWRAWILSGSMRIAILLFFTALLLHAWVGLRDVIMDYVHLSWVRIGALSVVAICLIAGATWVAQILLAAESGGL